MGRKPKISYELKVINLEQYIKGEKGASELASILGISREQFSRWVNTYELNGAEGLKTHSKNTYYFLELKYSAVNDYLSSKGSLCDICNKYNISSHIILHNRILKYNNSHKKFIIKEDYKKD